MQPDVDLQRHVLDVMSRGHIRVAVMGNVDSGKSTLIGTLRQGHLDDGNGINRKYVTKFYHELESGRTSTVTSHLLAFDSAGESIVPPRNFGRYTEAYLAQKAQKCTVSLMDVAGHEKYLKTTIAGLSRGMADYALVLVNASQGVTYMTNHHLGLCQMCGVPVIVVITKVDSAPPDVLRHTRSTVATAIRSSNIEKSRFAIRKTADIAHVCDKMHSVAPVLELSCVSGEGLDLLQYLLCALPQRRIHSTKMNRPLEFLLEQFYTVPGVGLVLFGFVNAGKAKKGDTVYAGPLSDGAFIKTTIKSIHVAQTVVDEVWAGHSACFAVSLSKKQKSMLTRKGIVLLSEPMDAPAVGFTADICLAKGDSVTMIKGQTQTTMHILHLKQACRLEDFDFMEDKKKVTDSFDNAVLRPGQRAVAKFKFLQSPQYVRSGMRVIIRDGHVRGVGIVKGVQSST
ncbi:hypothetical protein ACA910_021056 [Epithemia clementina (nom. ined.)]